MVLVIENEEQVRNMVKEMFSVLEARDGIEASGVFRLHQDEIRCVICDLSMPRMDGWDTLAPLLKLSPYPGDSVKRLRRGSSFGRRTS